MRSYIEDIPQTNRTHSYYYIEVTYNDKLYYFKELIRYNTQPPYARLTNKKYDAHRFGSMTDVTKWTREIYFILGNKATYQIRYKE